MYAEKPAMNMKQTVNCRQAILAITVLHIFLSFVLFLCVQERLYE